VVFFTAFPAFVFPLALACIVSKAVALEALVDVKVWSEFFHLVPHTIDDKSQFKAFIGGVFVFCVDDKGAVCLGYVLCLTS
jgi:hypothetical protein